MILNYAKKYSLYFGFIVIWIICIILKIIEFIINIILNVILVLIEKTIISLFKKIVKYFEEVIKSTIMGDYGPLKYSDLLPPLAKKLSDKAKLIENKKNLRNDKI